MRTGLLVLLLFALPLQAVQDPVQDLLQRAQNWESRYRTDLARTSLNKLLTINPDEPRALSMLVRLAVKERQPDQAAYWLERLQKVAPGSFEYHQARIWTDTLEADRQALQQARLLARSGRVKEAVDAYRKLYGKGLPEPDIALEYYTLLAQVEGGLRAALAGIERLRKRYPGHMGVRLEWIALKLRIQPANPALLDELYGLLQQPDLERQVHAMIRRALFRMQTNGNSIPHYRRYLQMDPEDQGVRALLAEAEKKEKARRQLLNNPSWKAGQRGLKLLRSKQFAEAEKALRTAVAGLPQREEFVGGLAEALMEQGKRLQAAPWYDKAAKLSRYDRDKWLSLKKTALFWGHLQQAREQMQAGALDAAGRSLDLALEVMPDQPYGLSLRAQWLQQKGDLQAAETLYRRILRTQPEQASALSGLLELWLDQGKAGQASAALKRLTPAQKAALGSDLRRLQVKTYRAEAALYKARGEWEPAAQRLEQALKLDDSDPWLLYDLARVYLQLGREQDARTLFQQALQKRGDDPDLRYAHALLLDVLDEDEQALQELESLPPEARSEQVLRNLQRLRIAVHGDGAADDVPVERTPEVEEEQHHSAELNMAWDVVRRRETQGKSSLLHERYPVEYRFESQGPGQWFVRIEPTRMHAGRLNMADVAEVREFGQGLFCAPDCDPRYAHQLEQGTAIGVGYENDKIRMDLGSTPLGFPVQDWVGGLRYDGNAGWLYWGVDISRRPMTSTLLAFAGTRDPYTGQVWGGVRKNGISFNAGHDTGGDWGFWSQLDLHRLTGRNVADNDRVRLMGGIYWRLINQDDLNLSLGVNGHLWWHDKVLDEFTWTQGGYYSPNRYRSLGVNADAFGRLFQRRLSWRVKASWSRSWSYEETTPWFVDDAELQQRADQEAIDPFFEGGKGGGPGYSLLAALEYKVNQHLHIGIQADVERSDFYEPDHLSIWVQYHFDGEPSPVHSPPDPLRPYSEF